MKETTNQCAAQNATEPPRLDVLLIDGKRYSVADIKKKVTPLINPQDFKVGNVVTANNWTYPYLIVQAKIVQFPERGAVCLINLYTGTLFSGDVSQIDPNGRLVDTNCFAGCVFEKAADTAESFFESKFVKKVTG